MSDKRPAHEVLLDRISAHCIFVQAIAQRAALELPSTMETLPRTAARNHEARLHEYALQELLAVLRTMVVPKSARDELVRVLHDFRIRLKKDKTLEGALPKRWSEIMDLLQKTYVEIGEASD